MTERLPKNLRRRAGADRIAAMEAAPDAPESLRERVAEALYVAFGENEIRTRALAHPHDQRECRYLADAAIAVICTPVDGAP